MKKSMKKLFTILFVLLFACRIFAAEGVVTFVKGKVEVKRGNSWVALKVGDKVAQSEVINTGFQSEAKVKLMNNVLYLGPVTRVTLSTLSESEDKDKVNVYLSTGSIRSKVNRTDTKRVSYTVRTPIAVASVRGTEFTNLGIKKIIVEEGTIGLTNNQRLSTPEKSKEDKDDKSDDDEKKSEDGEDVKDDNATDDSKPSPAPSSVEDTINENLEKFTEGDNVPGEQTLSKGQQISMDNTSSLGTGSSLMENKIGEITGKVAPTADKEGTQSEAPAASKPIIEDVVNEPTTGSMIIVPILPPSSPDPVIK